MGSRPDLDDALTVERLDASTRAVRGAVPFTVAAVALIVTALGDSVSWSRKLTWAGLMLVAVVLAYAAAVDYQRRRRHGPVLEWRAGVMASVCIGLGWGSLVLIAFPPPGEGALRALILVFAVGISSVTILSTAPSRARFFAVNVPMTLLLTTVYVSSGDGTTRMLGFAVPLYFTVMTVVHGQVHRLVMTNMRLKYELEEAAMIDALTGLLNRRAFTEMLDGAVARAHRSGERIGVLYLDLDDFKSINDRYGHDVGDRVLAEVGQRLRSTLRQGEHCGRLGGDEFAVLAFDLHGAEDLEPLATRVLRVLSDPVAVGADSVPVGVSIGGAVLRGNETTSASLLKEADTAQYCAKRAGGRRIQVPDAVPRQQPTCEQAPETVGG